MLNINGISDTMFTVMPIFIFCIFAIVIIGFIVVIIKGLTQWSKNNSQPILIVSSKIISKRTNISSGMHNDTVNINHSHTYTSYYITFEVESGSRMEFCVNDQEYGLLIEGDAGMLKFQGTRYLGFERTL